MRVLHVTPTYYPATYWGGPIFSVHGLVQSLARIPGVEVKVLSTDAAGPNTRLELPGNPVVYPPGFEVHFSRRLACTAVAPGLLVSLVRHLAWADIVHLTGTYSFPTLPTLALARLAGTPIVWSPRGALQASYEWAGARRRRLKRLWELACRPLAAHARCLLHVTSATEKAASLALLGDVEACVIPNGVEVPACEPSRRGYRPQGVLRLLYLGRLDPKKGLENLFQAIARLADLPTSLKLCGTGDPAYVGALRALARRLHISSHIDFAGHVDDEAKAAAFAVSDVCVLPSHSENFGMVVAEALGHCVPVIASRATPWQGLETRQCGLWCDNSPESLAAAIRNIAGMNLRAMGLRGRAWMQKDFACEVVAERMLRAYRSLESGNARPATA
jgi:glycosyltransferase involved in cell wall biosynthesis